VEGAEQAAPRVGVGVSKYDDKVAVRAEDTPGLLEGAAEGTKAVVAVLEQVAGAVGKTLSSADTMLASSQAVEAAARSLRAEVEGFLRKVAV